MIPNIFYTDIRTGLQLFVDCMGFDIAYSEPDADKPFYVVKRDTVKAHLVQDEEYAVKDRPELRIETDDIEGMYKEVSERNPELLHPNLKVVTLREWGAREFALRDASDVCIIFMQWGN